ncbi:MAG: M1 family peptidase, partial [Chitinophagaceae bacterium]
MKKLLSLLVFTHLIFWGFSQKPGAPIDMKHYVYQLTVNDSNDSVVFTAVLTYKILNPVSSISLDLVSINDAGKGMKVTSVTGNKESLSFRHSANKLTIDFAGKTGEIKTVIISYTGIPADGLIISKTKYGKRSFFADNWPDRAKHWLVSVDDPADKAAIEFIVSAPTHYQVIANGVLIEESNIDARNKLTHWKEAID